MKTVSVVASVSGTVLQDIVFDNDVNMTPEEFIARLNSGEICTTVSHGEGNGLVIQIIPEFKVIGKVVAMEAFDDMDISNFSDESQSDEDDFDLSEANDER